MNNDFQHGFRNLDFEPDKPDSAEHPDTQDNATDEKFRPEADDFMDTSDMDRLFPLRDTLEAVEIRP